MVLLLDILFIIFCEPTTGNERPGSFDEKFKNYAPFIYLYLDMIGFRILEDNTELTTSLSDVA